MMFPTLGRKDSRSRIMLIILLKTIHFLAIYFDYLSKKDLFISEISYIYGETPYLQCLANLRKSTKMNMKIK